MIHAGTGAGRSPDPASATSPSSPQTKLPFCRSDGPSAWVSNTGSLAHGRRRLRTYMPISEAPAAELPSAPLKYIALYRFLVFTHKYTHKCWEQMKRPSGSRLTAFALTPANRG